MSKYLFIQRSGLPWHGLSAISAQLKQDGHDVMLLLADEEKGYVYGLTRKFRPDYLLMPVITGEHDWVRVMSTQLRNELYDNVKLVLGGPHATFYPETVSYADYIIRGEADFLGTLLGRSEPGTYTMEPPRDITLLFEPDRKLYYDRYPHLAKASSKQFLTARGCPFNCTFCSNHLTHWMFPDTPLVRRKTPEQVFHEIYRVWVEWGLKTVSFSDDVFTLDKKWLSKFLRLYKDTIWKLKIPFICNTRYDIFDEELADMLVDAGCYGIEMGVESGVQELRSKVLGKGDKPNEAILKAAVISKAHGLKLKTYNIIGIPGETFEDAMQTVKLNQQLKADQTSCSFMTPYPKYDITKHYPVGTVVTSSIYQPGKWLDDQVVNLQTFFMILVKFPWLEGVVRKLCRVKPNRLFRLVALGMYGLFMARVHKLTVGDIWRYVRHIKPERI